MTIFPPQMPIPRNKRKLATLTRENYDVFIGKNHSWNTVVPEIQEDYVIQVSEETEGRVIHKLTQEDNKREIRNLGALFRQDTFFWSHKFGYNLELLRRLPEIRLEKPGVQQRSLSEWSSFWSRYLYRSVPEKFGPEWSILHRLNNLAENFYWELRKAYDNYLIKWAPEKRFSNYQYFLWKHKNLEENSKRMSSLGFSISFHNCFCNRPSADFPDFYPLLLN